MLGMTLSSSPFDQAHGDPEVLEGSKGQDGEPLQQFEGIEQEVRGAVRQGVPELQHHLPLGSQREPVLRDDRPQRVPAEPLETVPLVGRDAHAGIEVESILAPSARALGARKTEDTRRPGPPGKQSLPSSAGPTMAMIAVAEESGLKPGEGRCPSIARADRLTTADSERHDSRA